MHLSRAVTKLTLLGAFLLCIAVGFGLAVVLRERLEGTAEADPCFGQGELVSKWTANVTQQQIDDAAVSRPELRDAKAGPTEFRKCRSGPGYEVTLDAQGHLYSFTQPSPEQLESYYKDHPDEDPRNKMATAEQGRYVPSGLPQDQTAGCDPSWVKTTLDSVKAVVCHPPDWAILPPQDTNVNGVWIGTDRAIVGILPREYVPPDYNLNFACAKPELLNSPNGIVKLCTLPWDTVGGQPFGLFLPSGRALYAATLEDTPEKGKDVVIRVAVNVEELP